MTKFAQCHTLFCDVLDFVGADPGLQKVGEQCRASRMPGLKFLRMKCTYLGGPGNMLSIIYF